MARIRVLFKSQYHEAILSGRKTTTIRPRRLGWPGDTFHVGTGSYTITQVLLHTLDDAAALYFWTEGYHSKAAFLHDYLDIYPNGRTPDKRPVYVHAFVSTTTTPPQAPTACPHGPTG